MQMFGDHRKPNYSAMIGRSVYRQSSEGQICTVKLHGTIIKAFYGRPSTSIPIEDKPLTEIRTYSEFSYQLVEHNSGSQPFLGLDPFNPFSKALRLPLERFFIAGKCNCKFLNLQIVVILGITDTQD
ncbi:hypothetical protein RF11_13438 [Thelohanellus kitauei]|uniref:Uncharacterized protein n=1 Tax=Thelohanellus kitauei TaxID=669202 RepID=A0A0C2JR50_THEKT|nr:hypothetical protein RF11_13438 [Thelohanellus kitauei]